MQNIQSPTSHNLYLLSKRVCCLIFVLSLVFLFAACMAEPPDGITVERVQEGIEKDENENEKMRDEKEGQEAFSESMNFAIWANSVPQAHSLASYSNGIISFDYDAEYEIISNSDVAFAAVNPQNKNIMFSCVKAGDTAVEDFGDNIGMIEVFDYEILKTATEDDLRYFINSWTGQLYSAPGSVYYSRTLCDDFLYVEYSFVPNGHDNRFESALVLFEDGTYCSIYFNCPESDFEQHGRPFGNITLTPNIQD